ncbi:MAG: Uma2 family endonuclease [Oscillatoria sp. SIO1A7]|nr:Uma2 family endonuclease [Oscillatoria sp. SIO1A7]
MVQQLEKNQKPEIIYPDSDGKPMSDNTEQYKWIVIIKENLEIIFAAVAEVFIAGDLLWYPTEGSRKCQAPDVMVVFGRPKGKRGSYKQWLEEDIPPQVAFEILSPSNTKSEMSDKLRFYQSHGVEEYYIYDPDRLKLTGYQREGGSLKAIEKMNGWISPRLGIRFEMTKESLELYRPNGQRFLTSVELEEQVREAQERAAVAEDRAQQARAEKQQVQEQLQQTQEEKQQLQEQATEAKSRIQALEEILRRQGINLDDL